MRRRRHGGHNYKFTEKTHSIRGIVSIVFAILSLLSCGGMIWYSYSSGGIFGFFVAVISFILSISSIREPETFRVIPYVSLGCSLAVTAVWIVLYIGGI